MRFFLQLPGKNPRPCDNCTLLKELVSSTHGFYLYYEVSHSLVFTSVLFGLNPSGGNDLTILDIRPVFNLLPFNLIINLVLGGDKLHED